MFNKKLLESKSFFNSKNNHSNNLSLNLHNAKFIVSKFQNSTKSKEKNIKMSSNPKKQIEENKKPQSSQEMKDVFTQIIVPSQNRKLTERFKVK